MKTPTYKEAKARNASEVKIVRDYKLNDIYKTLGLNKTYFIKTYGCQMNERDSETIGGILEEMGYKKASDYLSADLILLNTCAIRENAHNKAYGMLGRVKHLKESKDVVLGLCGCMAQEEEVINEVINKHKYIDFVFGTHNIYELPEILNNYLENKEQEIEVYSNDNSVIEDLPVVRESKYKAYINITYGCDKFCTYCIVPFTRGKERSRLKEDIIKEVKGLIKEGYKEVTLLGQNVNSYGKELGYNFNDLLKEVSNTKIDRIKFVTSHPWDFTDDMIKTIKEKNNILPYFHLPVQSGSNKILKLMGRKYTKESYIELVNKIRTNIPGCSITTDIIVGFPNESIEDFNETIDVVNTCKFDAAYTFIYSPRTGTPAALMEDNVSIDEKEKRLSVLNKLITKYSLESNENLIDSIVSVLVEDKSNKEDMLMGYTETNKLINVKAPVECIGSIIDVKVTSTKSWNLYGEIKSKE